MSAIRGVAVVLSLAACGCEAPTLAEFERGRTEDLAAMQRLPPEEVTGALRDRVLREGLAVRNPIWVAQNARDQTPTGACAEQQLQDFECFYLVAPMREHLMDDYVALGDALRDHGDWDGAIGAYEDAISTADGLVLSVAAAARGRSTALRGEEKLWTDRREPVRAAAARLMARAEETWARTPEAEALERQYDQLMSQSQGQMQKEILEAAQAMLGALQASLSTLQSVSSASGSLGAGAAATSTNGAMALANRVGPQVARGLTAGGTKDFGILVGVLRSASGMLSSLNASQIQALNGTDAGKQAMVGFVASLRALRRGESLEGAKKVAADSIAGAPSAAAAPTIVDPSPPQAPTAVGAAAAPTGTPPSTYTAPPPPGTGNAEPPAPPSADDVEARLKRLMELRAKNAISEAEYQKQRQRILEGL